MLQSLTVVLNSRATPVDESTAFWTLQKFAPWFKERCVMCVSRNCSRSEWSLKIQVLLRVSHVSLNLSLKSACLELLELLWSPVRLHIQGGLSFLFKIGWSATLDSTFILNNMCSVDFWKGHKVHCSSYIQLQLAISNGELPYEPQVPKNTL